MEDYGDRPYPPNYYPHPAYPPPIWEGHGRNPDLVFSEIYEYDETYPNGLPFFRPATIAPGQFGEYGQVYGLLGGSFDTGTCAASVGSGPCFTSPVTCCQKATNLLGSLDSTWCTATCDSVQTQIQTNCTIFDTSHADDVAIRQAAQCVNNVWYGTCAQPSYISCGATCTSTTPCSSTCTTGTCPSGQTCGGGGVTGVCGTPACGACSPTCLSGTCPAGEFCGGGGTPGVCGSSGGGSSNDTTLLIFGGLAVAALVGAIVLTAPKSPAPAGG